MSQKYFMFTINVIQSYTGVERNEATRKWAISVQNLSHSSVHFQKRGYSYTVSCEHLVHFQKPATGKVSSQNGWGKAFSSWTQFWQSLILLWSECLFWFLVCLWQLLIFQKTFLRLLWHCIDWSNVAIPLSLFSDSSYHFTGFQVLYKSSDSFDIWNSGRP